MKTSKDFYQNLIFKFIRDVELFNNDIDRKNFFETLNENVDADGQIKLINDLENLDVPHLLINLANILFNHDKRSSEIYELLISNKIIPTDEIKKADVEDYEKANRIRKE